MEAKLGNAMTIRYGDLMHFCVTRALGYFPTMLCTDAYNMIIGFMTYVSHDVLTALSLCGVR